MFDELIRDIGERFALGPKAGELVQMLLGVMTDPETDGLEGFSKRFMQGGFGDVVQGWLTSPTGATSAPALSATQVDTVLGGPDGLLARIAARLGLDSATVASAVALAAPVIMRRLAVGGRWRSLTPTEIESMQAGESGLGAHAAPRTPPARRGGLLKWLPWLLLLLALLFYITRCQQPATDVARPAPVVVPAVSGAAQPTTVEAIPAGAGALASLIDGQPSLKVYFDSGKAEISPEFAERAKALVDYLRTHADAKAVVSGYSDPTGSAATNAAMSQQRAQAVSGALEAAGVAAASIVLEKPADITGTGDTNAESRRVEVTIRK
ncbi:OmpA family protein [Variovorax sp. LT2P21]|uniref:OmpA family protein n=1 Tax=Variovorax sp. LT2P21 TaxID=3443731 RepID=UPI003F476589